MLTWCEQVSDMAQSTIKNLRDSLIIRLNDDKNNKLYTWIRVYYVFLCVFMFGQSRTLFLHLILTLGSVGCIKYTK
jgi:hypothetical protein